MSKPTLLIMAAGFGSRYGGLKQIDPVGPHGETIMDYSIHDAIAAGFDKLVFVIRRDIEEPFRKSIGARYEQRIGVEYVFQELDKLPEGFAVPPQRQKPWGTGHAILMGKEAVKGPFAVINADDFYGPKSFQVLGAHLAAGTREYAMVGFILNKTLSEFGSVARGVCQIFDGCLQSVTELTGIEKDGAAAKYPDGAGSFRPLTGAEIVSMNMWGFNPTVFGHLETAFAKFLTQHAASEKGEFYIPTVVNELAASGREKVRVLSSPDSWFGVTYREDRPRVSESIRHLIAEGVYPEKLWK